VARLFSRYDVDGDGRLNQDEFRDYLKAIGFWGQPPYTDDEWRYHWQDEAAALGGDARGMSAKGFRTLYIRIPAVSSLRILCC